MRPISLKISAFGPYAGETMIPMDELGSQGLYLITGDTGAGKTTIFDAICFALFGEPSGNNRETSMLRSKYAKDDVPTEVDLVFTHSGKEYTVKRNPEYMRPAKKGDGVTKQAADANLYMPDGQVITKVREVNAAIENILGINREQFSQIAMLAQGDFLKLLLADTKTRQEIFRELFKTGYYQKLQYKLEEERKQVYGQVDDGRKSVNQYIQSISVDEDDVLAIEVDKAKSGNITTVDVLGLINRLIEQDKSVKEKDDVELAKINKDLEEVNGNIGTGEALASTKSELNKAENGLRNAIPLEQEANNNFEVAKEALKGKEQLDKEVAGIEAELPGYDELEKLKSEVANVTKNIEEAKKRLAVNEKTIADSKIELENLKEEQKSLKDVGVNIQKYNTELDKVKNIIGDITELKNERKILDEDIVILGEAQKSYSDADSTFRELCHKYEAMDQAYRNGLAGVLAEQLKDGDKCPVCGSTSHPDKAHKAIDVPTDGELEDAKTIAEDARKAANEAGANAGKIKAEVETKEAEWIRKAKKVLNTDADELMSVISEAEAKAKADEAEINNKLTSENKKVERKNKLEELIPTTEESINKLVGEIGQLKEQIASDNAKLEGHNGQIDNLKKSLHFENKKAANDKKNEVATKSAKIQADYETADNLAKEASRKIAGFKAKIEGYKKTISESKVVDLDAEYEKKRELETAQSMMIEKSQSVASRISNNEAISKNIVDKASEIAGVEKKLQWIKALADTANGKLTGKDKIMLETYVQTTYFDRIINRANLRLMTMSSGQYELKRQGEASNARSQSGLELGVIDHYNGTERSVKTLSGGESFMASLSLALGLSDEVQSSAGGIQIDTMFVDEGFGSLDSESLDQAYKALAGLTEGNRLVGIISHVAELKTKIDSKIVVTKEKSGGSRVEIQV